MLKPTRLLGAGCVLALGLAVAPAMAAAPVGVSGTIGGGYTNSSFDCSGCGHTDNWGFNGQAAFGFGSNDLAGELNAGYLNSSPDCSGCDSFNTWGIGGALFWSPDFGRIGGSVAWARTNIPASLSPFGSGGFDVDTVTYGALGEFFASDQFTLGGGLGGINISVPGGNAAAFYLSVGATGYVMPDLGITGAFQWADFDHGIGSVSALSIGAEWLVSEEIPVSIYGGYTRAFFPNGAPNANVWNVGLKFYFGAEGMPLVGHHRNGALDSLTSINTTVLQEIFLF